VGCAALFPQSEGSYIPPEVLHVLQAWIVSLDPELGSITVKENERYETWTVSIVPRTVIRTREGDHLAISDLRVGEQIEIRGTSRIGNHVTASEIELLEDRPEDEQERNRKM
jgi:hypothetical protein